MKIATFNGTWRFITKFYRAHHWPLSWTVWIELQTPILFVKIHFNVVSQLVTTIKNLYPFLISRMCATWPTHFSLDLITQIFGEGYKL
jgi:hypothetical protein